MTTPLNAGAQNLTLLTTKLYVPPPLPNLVERPRLVKRLDEGPRLGHRLTLISAPAGFGKTTLLSEWIADCGWPVAWISLDEGDNDPIRFLAYLIAALQTIKGNVGQGLLAALQSPGAVNVEAVLVTLLNEIAGLQDNPSTLPMVAGRGLVLALDDYHLIEAQPIHQALTFALDHMPPNMHLVIATRVDPPLPLARLRGRGQLTELRTADLRFTQDEITAFLNQVMGLGLSAEDIGALETRTEGWIVGLQLAALSLQDRADVTGFIRSFTGSHHHILDYLVEEVLRQQSPGTQSFLLQTSILERLTGPLCDAVCSYGAGDTDKSDGQATLERLAKSNLFIIPLDDERRWYRYHHLFADLLRYRLRRLHPDRLRVLHLSAVKWFEENGLVAEAVDHAFSARDYDRAADLIEQAASGTMLHGRVNTILRWLDALPENMLDTRPRLRFYQAWALSIAGQPRIAEKILLDAKSMLDSLPGSPEHLALRGELAALLTGIIISYNDPPRIIQEAEEALTYLPEEDLISRARVYIALGTAYAYSDEVQKAIRTYQQTRDLALSANNPFLATAAIELLADIQIYHQGRLKDAAQNLAQVLELGRAMDGTHQAFTGLAHSLLGEINLEWNDLEAASRYLDRGIELLQQGGIGYGLTHTYCAKARLKLALGETDRAIEALQSAEQAAQASPLVQFLIHNLAYQVKLALYLRDTKTALLWATGEKCELPESLPTHLHEIQQISLAWVHLAQGDLKETMETLNRIHPQAESAGRMAHVIEIYLLKASALQESGDPTAAIECLKSSLALAAPEGYIRTFVEPGKPMARLLREAAERGIAPTYVSNLLTAIETQGQLALPLDATQPTLSKSPLIEPLTDRELEVLRLMAEGLTYNEIAGQILVSLNTVRTHVKNIYGKLLVHKRSQAISKARELNLL